MKALILIHYADFWVMLLFGHVILVHFCLGKVRTPHYCRVCLTVYSQRNNIGAPKIRTVFDTLSNFIFSNIAITILLISITFHIINAFQTLR